MASNQLTTTLGRNDIPLGIPVIRDINDTLSEQYNVNIDATTPVTQNLSSNDGVPKVFVMTSTVDFCFFISLGTGETLSTDSCSMFVPSGFPIYFQCPGTNEALAADQYHIYLLAQTATAGKVAITKLV